MTLIPTAIFTDLLRLLVTEVAASERLALGDVGDLLHRLLGIDHDPGTGFTMDSASQGRPLMEPAPSSRATLADRAEQALQASGFPPYLVDQGRVVLSGFVVESEAADRARIRWLGQPAVDSAPYRRTFLRVYASILVDAGLSVRHVADEDEAYLICRAT